MNLSEEQLKKIAVATLQKCDLATYARTYVRKHDDFELCDIPAGALRITWPGAFGDICPNQEFYEESFEVATGIKLLGLPFIFNKEDMKNPAYTGCMRTGVGVLVTDETVLKKLAETGLEFPGSEFYAPKQKSHVDSVRGT